MRLLEIELLITGTAYLMAGLPVGGILLVGRLSPLYRVPTTDLCRWWSRFAFLVAVMFIARAAA